MRGGRLHRITFSKSLAEHLQQYLPGSAVQRILFTVGPRLPPGQESPSGLYAIVSAKKDIVLRITLVKEVAAELSDEATRYIAACWLAPGKGSKHEQPN